MDMITSCVEIVTAQITNDYSLSYSRNMLYKHCSKIISTQLIEKTEFNFDELLSWLERIKDDIYYLKYQCLKKILYHLNSYLSGRYDIERDNIIYRDSQSTYLSLSSISKKIIDTYINYKVLEENWCISTKKANRNYLAIFFNFLEKNYYSLEDLRINVLIKFKEYTLNYGKSSNNRRIILNKISNFIEYYYEDKLEKLYKHFLQPLSNRYINLLITNKFNNNYKGINITKNHIDLIDDYIKALLDLNYKKQTTIIVKRMLEYLLLFCYYNNIELSYEAIYFWADNILNNITTGAREYKTRAIKYYEFLNTKNINILEKCYPKNSIISFSNVHKRRRNYDSFPKWAQKMIYEYLDYRKNILQYQENTIVMDSNSIYRLIEFLDNNGINSFKEITPQMLISFSNQDKHQSIEGKNAYMCRIRSFIKYLFDKDEVNLYPALNILGKYRTQRKIISVIEENDLMKIYKGNYTTDIELRSIAIVLIALHTGLRSIDIVNLKFSNISFKEKTISIIQKKTQKHLLLPISIMALNAIYKYVKFGRVKSNSEYIFLSTAIPHNKVNRGVCLYSLNLVLNKNNISIDKYKGFHILRKTYASKILSNTNDISLTSFSLGHSSNETVSNYIAINANKMLNCPLSLEGIEYGGFSNE